MTTENYLGKIQRYEYMIKDKLDEINHMREMCMSISVSMDKENVKSSPNQDKLSDAIAKIVDLERETDKLVDGLIDERRRIINQIDALGDTKEYRILTMRYVKGMRLADIAFEMDLSIDSIKRIKKDSMKEFEKVYGSYYLKL